MNNKRDDLIERINGKNVYSIDTITRHRYKHTFVQLEYLINYMFVCIRSFSARIEGIDEKLHAGRKTLTKSEKSELESQLEKSRYNHTKCVHMYAKYTKKLRELKRKKIR